MSENRIRGEWEGRELERGEMEALRVLFRAKSRELSFVPTGEIPARQDNRPGKLDGQIIYRFESGRWVPLDGVHPVFSINSKPMAAGRRTFVSLTNQNLYIATDQDDQESS